MELVSRSKNVISQSKDLEVLHSLNSFPVFMGCVEHDESKDLHADLSWAISPNNGICLLYTSPSPRDRTRSRMPSSA